ncbi:MAG: trehalose-6-phosphate synthase [Acidimicrobiales bacterium]
MRKPSVIASNRGPVSFTIVNGEVQVGSSSGGLASGLGAILADQGITWIAAAVTDGDREAAKTHIGSQAGFEIQLVEMEPARYRLAYDVIANQTLWFMLHDLWDLPRMPRFDGQWREAWSAYRELNDAFAAQIAESAAADSAVLVQDYHLLLVGARLAELRPDLTCIHFSHTPFSGPDSMRVLPLEVSKEILEGMNGFSACGFHTKRWANRFESSANEFIGETPTTFVSALPSSAERMKNEITKPGVVRALHDLRGRVGERRLLVRVDRIELSKNIVRGFLAFEEFLDKHPEWHEEVVFEASCQPSREGVPEYQTYRTEVEKAAGRINERFGTTTWQPVRLVLADDYAASMALLASADAVLVNPTRDGLNLVAREAVLLNDRDTVLILSREAGIADELGEPALTINPFDVSETASAIAVALTMDRSERADRFARLYAAATERNTSDWLDDQLSVVNNPK